MTQAEPERPQEGGETEAAPREYMSLPNCHHEAKQARRFRLEIRVDLDHRQELTMQQAKSQQVSSPLLEQQCLVVPAGHLLSAPTGPVMTSL